jgi:hypothetical protein
MGLSIPEDFPLTRLVAQVLTEVRIGSHHVRLEFQQAPANAAGVPTWKPGASVEIEAGFSLRRAGMPAQSASATNLAMQAGSLAFLLQKGVSSVERLAENELLLIFAPDAELRLLTDPTGFESYHVHIDGDSVDVTAP